MKKPFTIIIKNSDGWWSAFCAELEVSGFGASREEAIDSVVRSIRSTLATQAALLKKDSANISHMATVRLAAA